MGLKVEAKMSALHMVVNIVTHGGRRLSGGGNLFSVDGSVFSADDSDDHNTHSDSSARCRDPENIQQPASRVAVNDGDDVDTSLYELPQSEAEAQSSQLKVESGAALGGDGAGVEGVGRTELDGAEGGVVVCGKEVGDDGDAGRKVVLDNGEVIRGGGE